VLPTLQVYAGVAPPLIPVAVNVTEVAAQIVSLVPDERVTDGTMIGLTAITAEPVIARIQPSGLVAVTE
jgi:hypothetical protein